MISGLSLCSSSTTHSGRNCFKSWPRVVSFSSSFIGLKNFWRSFNKTLFKVRHKVYPNTHTSTEIRISVRYGVPDKKRRVRLLWAQVHKIWISSHLEFRIFPTYPKLLAALAKVYLPGAACFTCKAGQRNPHYRRVETGALQYKKA